MAKKKRNHNPNLVRTRHLYTLAEIAEIYNLHLRTVQGWLKQGLAVAGKDGNSYLVAGEEVKRFLKERRQKHKHPLKVGEFYCPKCQNPRKSLSNKLAVVITDKRLGKNSKQAFIKGICEICNTRLNLFSSDTKAQEWQEKALFLQEHKKVLSGSEGSFYNTDLTRGEECQKSISKMNA